MIKIAHLNEVKLLQHLPQEVAIIAGAIAAILDSEYGEDRDVDCGDGGYVLVIESANEFEELSSSNIDIDNTIGEYTDGPLVPAI